VHSFANGVALRVVRSGVLGLDLVGSGFELEFAANKLGSIIM